LRASANVMPKKVTTETAATVADDKVLITAYLTRQRMPRLKNIAGLIVAKARQKLLDSLSSKACEPKLVTGLVPVYTLKARKAKRGKEVEGSACRRGDPGAERGERE
jgi:hypothetical protein